jgi:hypothetical protein
MQLQEFRQDLNARIVAAKVSGFWKDSDKDRWINKAIVRACNFARFKFLSKHATQLTELNPDGSGKESYFLPFDYKPGGMIFLSVDGEEYHKVGEQQYLSRKSDNKIGPTYHPSLDIVNPSSQTDWRWQKIYALIGDEYFIDPVSIVAGKIIELFYKRRPVRMVEETDEPITPEEMDEPVLKLALATCLAKEPGRKGDGEKEVLEAHALLQQIKDREDEEPSSVFIGQAKSTRWG